MTTGMCWSDCRYLESRLSSEQINHFYFFSSFFFTKLLGDSNASRDIDECEVDYIQVRRWTGEVNLFEKDYVFIPIVRR
jgi:sentrin-specific protease 7